MELTESVDELNSRLVDHYGIDTSTGQPMWRIVWSDDQYEMRLTDCTDSGIILSRPEIRLLPKYKQWIHQKYILERLVAIPVFQQGHLPASKLSYENIWTFEDKNGNYLPPKWEAAKFVIDLIYAVQFGDHSIARYRDPESTQEEAIEFKKKKIDGIVEELFGDESGLLGTTITGETIIVPQNYKKVN